MCIGGVWFYHLGGGAMANAVARAYNGGLGAVPPAESMGQCDFRFDLFFSFSFSCSFLKYFLVLVSF